MIAQGQYNRTDYKSARAGLALPSSLRSVTNPRERRTLEKIAKALGVKLSELFETDDNLTDINSYDASLMEKIKLIEGLSEEEKKTVFNTVDAFIGKKKLKDALENALQDVK